jgi:enoyl-CoA hydratase/carnithine racemase
MTTLFAMCTKLMMEISNFPVPTICAINGLATAAGCQLVASCDLAIATCTTSKFATPGVNIGLFCSTPAVALLHNSNLAYKHVMEMLLLGDSISAQRAYEIGLIKDNYDNENNNNESDYNNDDAFQQAVYQLANKIVSKPSTACIRLGIQTLRKQQQQQLGLQAAYQLAQETMVQNLIVDNDAIMQGIQNILNKSHRRTPPPSSSLS